MQVSKIETSYRSSCSQVFNRIVFLNLSGKLLRNHPWWSTILLRLHFLRPQFYSNKNSPEIFFRKSSKTFKTAILYGQLPLNLQIFLVVFTLSCGKISIQLGQSDSQSIVTIINLLLHIELMH